MRSDGIAGALGRFPSRKQLVEDGGQDRRPSLEASVVCEAHRPGLCVGWIDEAQRVDIERADDARIEALEIEYPDILVNPGDGFEDVASGLATRDLGVVGSYRRRHDTTSAQRRQVQEVEGCNACRNPVRRHACQAAARQGKGNEVEFLDDFEREARIRSCVLGECREVVAVAGQDVVCAIACRVLDPGTERHLPFAEYLAGHAVERIIVEPLKGAAQEIHAVEHEATGNGGLPTAEIPASRTHAHGSGVAPEMQRDAGSPGDSREHVEVEVDHVPAGQHVGVDRADAVDEGGEGFAFRGKGVRPLGHVAAGFIDDQHLVNALPVQGNGEQASRRRVGLDVEGQHRRTDRDVGRTQEWVVEDAVE